MIMINKTKFLREVGCSSGRLAKEINELIFNWHCLSGIDIDSNEIDDSLVENLYKASIYWKNLVLSESDGFRDSMGRRTFHYLLKRVLDNDETITYFGILCPSYKKGIGSIGFASEPGNTTYRAFCNLERMIENTKLLKMKCEAKMFFADISVENFDKLSKEDWDDLDKIIWLDSIIAKSHNIPFFTLSQYFPELDRIVGKQGKIVDVKNINVSEKALQRSFWRDRQFYPNHFGWTLEESEMRTIIHAHSYFYQGECIRKEFKNPVMVYSAYDYEKAGLYSGKKGDLLPAVIFPLKYDSNPSTATIPFWKIK